MSEEKREYETHSYAGGPYVEKDHPLILFRGALDHAEAVVILLQTQVEKEAVLAEGPVADRLYNLLYNFSELLELLRKVMSAEARNVPLEVDTLFGLTLDELQYRSHHAEEFYGVPTMTRPDYRFGEIYAGLNLLRTELRQVETAAVRLFLPENREEGRGEDGALTPTRPDILHVLNRLSSAAHVLMCQYLSENGIS